MAKVLLIDTHVHLYAQPHFDKLSWLTPDNKLYRDCRLDEYKTNRSDHIDCKGMVFVETDVKFDLSNTVTGYDNAIDEYLWIERIIDRHLFEKEGVPQDDDLIRGIIPWAPIPNGASEVLRYVDLLKTRSQGDVAFSRIKGFRYLVQDKDPKTMLQPLFIEGLQWLADNNYVFELGIDMRSAGLWQLEEFVELISQTHNVKYMINHLTKPNLQIDLNSSEDALFFNRWKQLIKKVAENKQNQYVIKFSGCFSEIHPGDVLDDDKCVELVIPWFEVFLKEFGEDKIVWGSDWPVCTVNGGVNAWERWAAISWEILNKFQIDLNKVYYSNALTAYNLA